MKRFKCLMCIMTAVFMLAGCGSAFDSASGEAMYDMAVNGKPVSASGWKSSESYYSSSLDSTMGAVTKEEVSADTSLKSSSQTDTAGLTERKYIRSFRITVETLEFDNFVAGIENEVKALGGYIESSSISGTGINVKYNNRQANITARVPNEVLDEFVNMVGNAANITYKYEDTKDVTLSYIDMESRVKTLEVQHERLLVLLEKADTVDNIISLENRLSDVLYEIEYYKSQLRNYDSLISYSTVNLAINEVIRMTVVEEDSFGERISNGLSETFYEMGEDIKDFVAGFVINLPYIVIWGVILAVAVIIVVRIFKKLSRKASENKKTKIKHIEEPGSEDNE